MTSFKEKDKEYIANTYARFDLEIAYGKGALVYDINFPYIGVHSNK